MADEAKTKTRIVQNDVTRPEPDTTTGQLWAIADRESEKLGKPAPRKVVTDAFMAEVKGANIATANTQYARWVKFHGVSDILRNERIASTAEAKEARKAEAEAAKQAKAAEKEEAKQKAEAEKAEKARVAEAEKAQKAEEAAAKKAAKEQEKAAKAAEREAEKQRKADEKAAAKAAAAAQPAA